ncbi:MAG TPA: CHRD domain-containing protein [Gemmatimonas sp.]|nr:CHRD domain-containing protein [Gemmatimonas sp.]
MPFRPVARSRALSTLSLVGLLLAGGVLASCSDDDNPVTPTPLVRFRAALVGSEEVPPVASAATGNSEFTLSRTNDTLYVNITVNGLSNVRFGHFHTGARGANGGVVAFLVDGPPTLTGVQNGRIGKQFITAANLVNSLAGQPLSALIDQMRAGGIYVNLHTDANPGGELRGQIALVP